MCHICPWDVAYTSLASSSCGVTLWLREKLLGECCVAVRFYSLCYDYSTVVRYCTRMTCVRWIFTPDYQTPMALAVRVDDHLSSICRDCACLVISSYGIISNAQLFFAICSSMMAALGYPNYTVNSLTLTMLWALKKTKWGVVFTIFCLYYEYTRYILCVWTLVSFRGIIWIAGTKVA